MQDELSIGRATHRLRSLGGEELFEMAVHAQPRPVIGIGDNHVHPTLHRALQDKGGEELLTRLGRASMR